MTVQPPDFLGTTPADLGGPRGTAFGSGASPATLEVSDVTVEPEGSASPIQVAVVDADEATRSQLATQIGTGATPFPTLDSLAGQLDGRSAVVVLGPSCASGDELSQAEIMLNAHPATAVVLIADELSTSLLQLAMRAAG